MNALPIRQILLADDQASVRAALRLRLEQEPNFAIVGEAVDAPGLLLLVAACAAELVLLDWELPGLAPKQLVRLLYAEQPGLKIVAMSSRPEAHQLALQAGVTAFLSKGAPPEDLLKTLASV
ncbi:MAG: response regulator transcription factor [Chloroflexia bacterium]|nr:response regulator transcription factor [Chloroflexia bacterium]